MPEVNMYIAFLKDPDGNEIEIMSKIKNRELFPVFLKLPFKSYLCAVSLLFLITSLIAPVLCI